MMVKTSRIYLLSTKITMGENICEMIDYNKIFNGIKSIF